MVLQFMQIPQDFAKWLEATKENLVAAKSGHWHSGKFDLPPVREAALAFEEMVSAVGIKFVFQHSPSRFYYYLYW